MGFLLKFFDINDFDGSSFFGFFVVSLIDGSKRPMTEGFC